MIKTFFHRDQPFTRYVTLVAFCVLILMAFGFWFKKLHVPDPSTEWFLGYMAVLSAAALSLPTALLRLPRFRLRAKPSIAGFYELLAVLGMALAWAGTFGLYGAIFEYDTFIHFMNSALFTYVILDATARAFPEWSSQWWKVLAIAAFVGFAGGIGNELFEWGGDLTLGTKMFGKAGVAAATDTEYDLVADAAGILVGIATAQKRKGWLRL